MTMVEPGVPPDQPSAQDKLMTILAVDLKNLEASMRMLGNNAPLHSALRSAHTTLEMLTSEASAFQTATRSPWLALHFLRATEFSWAAAVRSILMLHRAEAMSNIRVALEMLGCALVSAQLKTADVDGEPTLHSRLFDTAWVGKQLNKLEPTPTLKALKDRKLMCSSFGAHGNLYQLAGRLKNERCEQSGTTQRLCCDFSYADLQPTQIPAMLAWLVGVAAGAALLFRDDLCAAAHCSSTPAFHASFAELDRHAKLLSARYPLPTQEQWSGDSDQCS